MDKPYPSWELKTVVDFEGNITEYWDSPKPVPLIGGKIFVWNEDLLDWVEA